MTGNKRDGSCHPCLGRVAVDQSRAATVFGAQRQNIIGRFCYVQTSKETAPIQLMWIKWNNDTEDRTDDIVTSLMTIFLSRLILPD